ncbi:MAG TPA: hypothetical protein VF901_04300, partial [Bradyrhizobium sp.]
LYWSAEEIEPFFTAHCAMQIPAPDRMPNTFDVGLIEPVMLSTASVSSRPTSQRPGDVIRFPAD